MPAAATDAEDAAMPRQRPVLALGVRLMAGIGLATMLMLVKLADRQGVDLVQILFVRQAVSIPILLGYLAMRGQLHAMRTDRLGGHATRAGIGLVGMALNFAAPILLPLAVVTTLGFTAPVFAVILSAAILRERVGKWRWGAAALGFAGIALIARPSDVELAPLAILVGLGAAFMIALISIQVRDLTRTEDPLAIVAWFSIFTVPILFVASLFFDWRLDAAQWLILVTLGLVGTISQVLLTVSLRLGKVSSVVTMDYAMLIWSTGYGWLIFGNLPPETLWLGAPLVILAGAIIVWREQVLAKKPVVPFGA